jgi:hypothetical protein
MRQRRRPWTSIVAVLALVFEPGVPVSHTLTVQAADNCGQNGGNTGGHFKVNSMTLSYCSSVSGKVPG